VLSATLAGTRRPRGIEIVLGILASELTRTFSERHEPQHPANNHRVPRSFRPASEGNLEPIRRARTALGLSFQGLHRNYFRFGEADKLFIDSALAYRYAAAPSLLFGVVQAFSYAKLQLLDTEGNTLPRDRFIAYSGEVRGYTQWLAARSRLTVGAGLRRKDINEIADQATVAFQSLDHQGYFASFDGLQRFRQVDVGLGYEYAVLHYAELRAAFQNSTTSEANPLLTLIQHTARSQVAVRLARWGRLSLMDRRDGCTTHSKTS
jgi:hypothetical protein